MPTCAYGMNVGLDECICAFRICDDASVPHLQLLHGEFFVKAVNHFAEGDFLHDQS